MTGALCGLIGVLGLLLVAHRLPLRRASLLIRVEPYLGTVLPGRSLGPSRSRSLTGSLAEVSRWGADRLDGLLGGDASVQRRLRQLGGGSTQEFRISQLTWGGATLGVVLGLGLLRAAAGSPIDPPVLALLTVGAGVGGALARDRALSRAVVARQTAILAEFPAVADLIALSVTAGEGPLGALERVAQVCRGELAAEFRRTLGETRAGTPIVAALESLADRTGVPVLRRFVDGLVVALERGTPLAEVLRAQAADVRETSRHALIETAARKEVAMMIPVVFLVLPVTVVFAMFPGFYGLSLTVS